MSHYARYSNQPCARNQRILAGWLCASVLSACPGVPPVEPPTLDLACDIPAPLTDETDWLRSYLGFVFGSFSGTCDGLTSALTKSADPGITDGGIRYQEAYCRPPEALLNAFGNRRLNRDVEQTFTTTDVLFSRVIQSGETDESLSEINLDSGPYIVERPIRDVFAPTALPAPAITSSFPAIGYRYSCDGYIAAEVDFHAKSEIGAGPAELEAAVALAASLNGRSQSTLLIVSAQFPSPYVPLLRIGEPNTDVRGLLGRLLRLNIWERYANGMALGGRVLRVAEGVFVATYTAAEVSGKLDLDSQLSAAADGGFASAEFQASLGIGAENSAESSFTDFATYVFAPQPEAEEDFLLQRSDILATLPLPEEIVAEMTRVRFQISPTDLEPVTRTTLAHRHHVVLPGVPESVCGGGWALIDESTNNPLSALYDTPMILNAAREESNAGIPSCRITVSGATSLTPDFEAPSVDVAYVLRSLLSVDQADPLDFSVFGIIPTTNQPRQASVPPSIEPIQDPTRSSYGNVHLLWNSRIELTDDLVPIDYGNGGLVDVVSATGSDLTVDCSSRGRASFPVTPEYVRVSGTTKSVELGFRTNSEFERTDLLPEFDVCPLVFALRVPLEGPLLRQTPIRVEVSLRMPRRQTTM